MWFGVGGAYVVRRGDCTTCEQDFPFLNDMGLLIYIGHRLSPQMDVAAEIRNWTPTSSSSDCANVTHFDAIAQDRPWKGHGFFLKGGAGMALVRNWVDVTGGGDSVRSKALSVVIGGGWAFHATERFSAQIFADSTCRSARRPADVGGRIPGRPGELLVGRHRGGVPPLAASGTRPGSPSRRRACPAGGRVATGAVEAAA